VLSCMTIQDASGICCTVLVMLCPDVCLMTSTVFSRLMTASTSCLEALKLSINVATQALLPADKIIHGLQYGVV